MPGVLQKHTIKNVNIDFLYNGKIDGFAVQNAVKDWVDDFINSLDKQLSDAYSSENILAIDGLEIDINVGVLNWQKEAGIQVAGKLKEKIGLLKGGITSTGVVTEKNNRQSFETAFLYFIEFGHLPWHSSKLSGENWDAGIQNLIEQPTPEFRVAVLRLFKRSVVFIERFIHSISPEESFKMFAPVIQERTAASPGFVRDLQLLLMQENVPSFRMLKASVYQSFLLFFVAQENISKVKEDVTEIVSFHAKLNPEIIIPISLIDFKSSELLALQKEIITTKPSDSKAEKFTADDKEDALDKSKLFFQSNDDAAEAIYISNAGLVIVAPYLPMFFENLKLAEDFTITDIDKAVCMINYLATGNTKMQEYELVLPKILCGLRPNTVINTSVVFSDELLQEASELLQSVIEHWSILKDASVDALRQTFLMREGKLSFDNNEWKLQVEKAQFDMLLDHLPWNISMIKLGWMTELLTTEWM